MDSEQCKRTKRGMKRDIGTTFTYNGKQYIVRALSEHKLFCCEDCAFKHVHDCSYLQENVCGECEGEQRGDRVNVYYEELS